MENHNTKLKDLSKRVYIGKREEKAKYQYDKYTNKVIDLGFDSITEYMTNMQEMGKTEIDLKKAKGMSCLFQILRTYKDIYERKIPELTQCLDRFKTLHDERAAEAYRKEIRKRVKQGLSDFGVSNLKEALHKAIQTNIGVSVLAKKLTGSSSFTFARLQKFITITRKSSS